MTTQKAEPSGSRTVESVKQALGVPKLQVVYDAAQLEKQRALGGSVDFVTAVERALHSLIEDPADGPRYTAATAVRDNWDPPVVDPSAANLKRIIREHLNQHRLYLQHDTLLPESGTVEKYWIFRLKDGMGDLHWVLVDRSGSKPAFQEIT